MPDLTDTDIETALAAFAADLDVDLTLTAAPAYDVTPATSPVAQGDVLAVPTTSLPDGTRWTPATLNPTTLDARPVVTGRHNHVLSGTGITWTDGPRTGHTIPGMKAVIHIPSGTVAYLKHTGGEHATIALAAGTWLLIQQRSPIAPAIRATPAPVPTITPAPTTGRRTVAASELQWGPVYD